MRESRSYGSVRGALSNECPYRECRDFTTEILRHGVLLVVDAPCKPRTLAGQELGRTITLSDTVCAKECAGSPC